MAREPKTDARGQIAEQAARFMVDHGINDFAMAKRKALDALRLPGRTPLPSNQDVELAVLEYQRLFRSDHQVNELRDQRATALEVMRALESFKPRLAGSVLTGSASPHAVIEIHVFSDPPERLATELLDRQIIHHHAERRIRATRDLFVRIPVVEVVVNDLEVELWVFSGKLRSTVPLSPVDNKPIQRANIADLEALLAAAV